MARAIKFRLASALQFRRRNWRRHHRDIHLHARRRNLTTAGRRGGRNHSCVSAGAERARSRETRVDAGLTTLGFKDGAVNVRSRAILGAGAMMLESRIGAMSACSDRMLGTGATTAEFRDGVVRDV